MANEALTQAAQDANRAFDQMFIERVLTPQLAAAVPAQGRVQPSGNEYTGAASSPNAAPGRQNGIV